MTHFERTYLLNRPPKIAISFANGENKQSDEYLAMQKLQECRQELNMQLEYRELDRLAMELEKELQACKAIRMELEKFKMEFSVSVEDEATKKVQEVIKNIDTMLK